MSFERLFRFCISDNLLYCSACPDQGESTDPETLGL